MRMKLSATDPAPGIFRSEQRQQRTSSFFLPSLPDTGLGSDRPRVRRARNQIPCSQMIESPDVLKGGLTTKHSNDMKFLKPSTMIAAMYIVAGLSAVQSQEQKTKPPKQPTTNQLLMRDKLTQMNRVLEGITLGRFDQVEESAKTLGMISKATSWHIAEQTPRYKRLSKNFQEQAADLERHAREKDEEAATLDLVRMNITCADCHQHMRAEAARGK
jgi:hypothetical protein